MGKALSYTCVHTDTPTSQTRGINVAAQGMLLSTHVVLAATSTLACLTDGCVCMGTAV